MRQSNTHRRATERSRLLRWWLIPMLLLGVLALPGGLALAADPQQVSFTLEGCRNDGTIMLPNGAGKFICPDSAYTSGNLGKGWNELDLVPYRLTADAGNSAPSSQTYTIAIVVDNRDAGHPGYDVLSVPVLNTALSSASCTAPTVGAATILAPGLGGIDQSLYRLVTITQAKNTTCVYDYYARLALGAHLFPGSSLHANLANQNLGTSGIGSKDVSIPVKEILPQELRKDMTATQGTDHIWNIFKEAQPDHLNFSNTCDTTPGSQSATVSITVRWERLAATPSGPITVITHVYAKNPASRIITVNVSDDIRSGTTVLDTSTSGPVDVPANTELLVLTHPTTVPSGTTNLNDVATATYTDKVTGVPVPGTTTATASATVQLSGPEQNQTATINDVESITGTNLKYSVDSSSGASGSFDGGYVAGTKTTGSVSWTSDSQSGNGSVTFGKTVYVTQPSVTNGTLSDVATLTGSDGFTASANASVAIQADAQVSLIINKSVSPALASGTQTFNFHVKNSSNIEVATPSITFNAGETAKFVTVPDLAPGSYTVTEDAVTGWVTDSPKSVTIALPACSGSVNFANTQQGRIIVTKHTDPAGSSQSFSFTTTGSGYNGFSLTDGQSNDSGFLNPGNYSVAETALAGWDLTSATCDSGSPGAITLAAGQTVHCSFTNTQRAHIIVTKHTNPAGSSQSFAFTTTGSGYSGFSLTDGQSDDSGALVPGSYSVAETAVSGWDLTSATCDSGSPNAISLAAGQTVHCDFYNRQRAHIIVTKHTNPAGSSQSFSFTTTGSGYNGFALTDGQSNDSGALVPGNYSVAETAVSGWDLTSATCDGGNTPGAIALGAGQTVHCSFTNTQRGHIIIDKTTVPGGDPQLFNFTLAGGPSSLNQSFQLADTTTPHDSGAVLPGSGYNAAETVPSGWDQTSATCDDGSPVTNIAVSPGETVTCTFTNTKRGLAKVVKTVNGAPPSGAASFTFQLRTGASATQAGTILETGTAAAANGGLINFATQLVPGTTYQLCEQVMPGWMTTLGPPFFTVYNPSGDNSVVCTDFTVAAGETKTFTINNQPPPGGLARTIGFWKNWASCANSNGNQKPVLDQTLAKAEPAGITIGILTLHGSTTTPNAAPDCLKAVRLLNKSTIDTGKKMASDPAFNLAAQLLAAKLNVKAGAGVCPAAVNAINAAQALLAAHNFDGITYTRMTSAEITQANNLATTLDNYNNNRLCGP